MIEPATLLLIFAAFCIGCALMKFIEIRAYEKARERKIANDRLDRRFAEEISDERKARFALEQHVENYQAKSKRTLDLYQKTQDEAAKARFEELAKRIEDIECSLSNGRGNG